LQQTRIACADCQVGQFMAAHSRGPRGQQRQRSIQLMLLSAAFPHSEDFLG
jgi:hypothetical protein